MFFYNYYRIIPSKTRFLAYDIEPHFSTWLRYGLPSDLSSSFSQRQLVLEPRQNARRKAQEILILQC
jgi:hypothetical protein